MGQIFDQSQRTLNRAPLDDPKILSGPFWAELRVFLAVAKAKSYNKAGEELGISRPKISRSVQRLQDMMGTVLLVSTNSGIKLTEKGKELANKLLPLDQLLFSMSNDMRVERERPKASCA